MRRSSGRADSARAISVRNAVAPWTSDDAGLQPRDHTQRRVPAGRRHVGRNPGVRAIGEGKPVRHDADDECRRVVDADRPSDDRRVAMELAAPQRRAEDHGGVPARAVDDPGFAVRQLLGKERPSEDGLHTEHAEESWRDAADEHALGLGASGNRALPLRERRQPRAGAAPGLPLDEVRTGNRLDVAAAARHDDELRRIGEGKRAQQRGIDRGEHRAGGADAERQRRHDRQRQRRVLPHRAEREAHVGLQIVQQRQAPRITAAIAVDGGVAEFQPRPARRFVGGKAAADEFGGAALEMEPQLVVHVAFEGSAAHGRAPERCEPCAA